MLFKPSKHRLPPTNGGIFIEKKNITSLESMKSASCGIPRMISSPTVSPWSSESLMLSASLLPFIEPEVLCVIPKKYKFPLGTILLPYILLHIFVGFPLVFLQMSIGQFAALGPAAGLERIASAASGEEMCLFSSRGSNLRLTRAIGG